MTWKRWSVALLNAFISGLASSVAVLTAASYLGVGALKALEVAGLTAAVSGVVSAAKWLTQHPLPGVEDAPPKA